MDIFIEKLVKKKRDTLDNVIIIGTIILAIALITLLILFLGPYATSMFLCIGIGYVAYVVIVSRRIEFEYALTNGQLEIDKIVNQKKRKNLIDANCRDFEIMAKVASDKFDESVKGISEKIIAVSSLDSQDIYFFITNKKEDEDEKAKRVLVLFEPNDKMLKSIKAMIPRKFFD
ncbi:MAG: hypothetical protein GX383_08100 [Clostridium sp.]|nr:hypothetical protein [Clostridium sp.]